MGTGKDGANGNWLIALRRPRVDRGVRHRDMGAAVGRDGCGIGLARDQRGVRGADRAWVSAGNGEWKTMARVHDRRGWGGLFGALTLRVCALLYRHYHVEDH